MQLQVQSCGRAALHSSGIWARLAPMRSWRPRPSQSVATSTRTRAIRRVVRRADPRSARIAESQRCHVGLAVVGRRLRSAAGLTGRLGREPRRRELWDRQYNWRRQWCRRRDNGRRRRSHGRSHRLRPQAHEGANDSEQQHRAHSEHECEPGRCAWRQRGDWSWRGQYKRTLLEDVRDAVAVSVGVDLLANDRAHLRDAKRYMVSEPTVAATRSTAAARVGCESRATPTASCRKHASSVSSRRGQRGPNAINAQWALLLLPLRLTARRSFDRDAVLAYSARFARVAWVEGLRIARTVLAISEWDGEVRINWYRGSSHCKQRTVKPSPVEPL